ncbi:MAG: hypothetical protein K5657_00455 [Desulfovibrio sp.]|nr:hypothetical protein [Desulfovibrio sp.]
MAISKHCGKWQVRIRRKSFPQQIKTFQYKSEAEAWEREIMAEMDRGVFVSRAEAEKTTLRKLLQRYLEESVPKLADPKREGNRVKYLMGRDLAKKFVVAIRSADIAGFIREPEAEGTGGNTIRLDIAALSRVFNLARTTWGFESITNPTEKVQRPKVNRGRERRLEPGEEKKLLAVASEKLRPCIRFALETAMRREEIASLVWRISIWIAGVSSKSCLFRRQKIAS